ncbi:hypothetical protein K437DRAFT_253365 [Tilletiaria anomala UBC 951]|uniref:Uncharacterized protein n=1 Tax=Tilletiaria anomala (strain ATCC 24038 / CBS 436.72 / UBC 951) TaxID=1037660 RepID=A0A066WGV6_TILAU|nr:uncharacterized protein K437DRAFT_253365 [Tilletiaria anomala UBC 951]KDN53041.1 hypothetical protein K437DRAFT_253365 [Tilletiaria anomala UBC 951]
MSPSKGTGGLLKSFVSCITRPRVCLCRVIPVIGITSPECPPDDVIFTHGKSGPIKALKVEQNSAPSFSAIPTAGVLPVYPA